MVNIAASEETLKLRETKQVMNVICAQTSDDAIIKFGAVFDDTLGDAMRVTVVATGLSRPFEVAAGTLLQQNARTGAGYSQGQIAAGLARGTGLKETPSHLSQHRSNLQSAAQPLAGQASRVLSAPRQPASNSEKDSNRLLTSPAGATSEN